MKIRCKIEREGGTPVRIDETDYHFTPNEKGDHVAEVSDPEHARKLLAVVEAYEPYGVEYVESGGAAPPVVVAPVEKEPELKGPDYNGLTRKQLEDAYEAKFGKRPPKNSKDDTILAKLTNG